VQNFSVLEGTFSAPASIIDAEDLADKTKISTLNEYATCLAQDQLLLSYLNNSMARDVLAQVVGCTTLAKSDCSTTRMSSRISPPVLMPNFQLVN
jgi:hypothetical protein